jgi:hypothetical protein
MSLRRTQWSTFTCCKALRGVLDEHGIARRGLLIRHLVLPGGLAGTEQVLEFLSRELSPTIGAPAPAHIDIINSRIIVLLGSTACLGVLREKIAVRARHGSLVERDGRTHLITCHPGAAARFPAIRRAVQGDFRKLRRRVM